MTVGRLRRAWLRHGALGFAVRAARIAFGVLYLREEHVWYVLELDEERPRQSARVPGLQLVRVAEDQPELIEQAMLNVVQAQRWRSQFAELWLVLSAGEPIFSTWLFHDAAPVFAARGGWIELPADTACMEDAVTRADMRGYGVASATWAAIADVVAAEGVKRIVAKPEAANVGSRRAHDKVGYRVFARMRLIRLGPFRTLRVETTSETPLARQIVAQLRHPSASVRRGSPRPRSAGIAIELPSVTS